MSSGAMNQRLDVISPHYDDAVYSAWHALNESARVITVFAGYPEDEIASSWDISTGFDNARIAMETRRQENIDALARSGAAIVDLAYQDVVYRTDDILQPVDIAAAIMNLMHPDVVLLAPVGFSYKFQHPDHIMTREAAKLLLAAGRNVQFYADIPYSLRREDLELWPQKLPVDVLSELVGTRVEVVTVELSRAQQEQKINAVRQYTSQFDRNNRVSSRVFDEPDAYRWEAIIKPV